MYSFKNLDSTQERKKVISVFPTYPCTLRHYQQQSDYGTSLDMCQQVNTYKTWPFRQNESVFSDKKHGIV